MTWEEYVRLTRTLLDFYSLTDVQKEQIFLMIDGLKFRQQTTKENQCDSIT